MTSFVANKLNIVEMSMDKLNLEEVFLKLTSQKKKRSGLEEILEETPEQPEQPAE